MKRYKIIFKGRVQGVGFRIRATMHAEKYHLTGYVRNRYDGDVECEVQGEEEAIANFIRALHKEPWIQIEKYDITEIPCKKESKFVISYRV